MSNKKKIDDYFDDNFEVTYTGALPSIDPDLNHANYNNHYNRSYDRTAYDYDNDYEDEDYADSDYEDYYEDEDYEDDDSEEPYHPPRRSDRKKSGKHSRSSSSEELAAPIQSIMRTGSTAAEKLTNFILRPAPVLMAGIITLITGFSFWNQMSDYGDIKTLSTNPELTLIAYLAIAAVMMIWLLSTFFFTLSGVWHGTGRGLTNFIVVYILSYLFSLAASAIPSDIELLTGIHGGVQVFGSLYPVYFPFCVIGIITCVLRKILK